MGFTSIYSLIMPFASIYAYYIDCILLYMRFTKDIYNGIAKFQLAETLLMSQSHAPPLDFVSA